MRQTTDITDSKRVFLNTHTAWTEHVQPMQYVSFNGTDVLYHVSNTTFFFVFFQNENTGPTNAAHLPEVVISALVP